LAELLGAPADRVRLLFYFPPPPGAGVYPPRAGAHPTAYDTFQEAGAAASAQVVKVAFPGPPGGGAGMPPPPGASGGWPGGFQGGGGGFGRGSGQGASPGPSGAPSGWVGSRSMGGPPSGARWAQGVGRAWHGQSVSSARLQAAPRDLP